MNNVTSDARALSSGTIAGLIGESKYTAIDKVQESFIAYCERHEGEFDTWVSAWHAFEANPGGHNFPLGIKIHTDRIDPKTGRHWIGVTLAANDPKAWTNTLAFPDQVPSQEAVDAHILYCRKNFPTFSTDVPVEWEYGQVLWEDQNDLIVVQDYNLIASEAGPQYTFLDRPGQTLLF